MTQSESDRILEGNRSLDATISIIRFCNHFGVKYILENPASSYLWSDPVLLSVTDSATDATIHQCAFGANWRKETRFCFGNFVGPM
jgi:hypothetical protein